MSLADRPEFPQELTENVIDYLWDDHPTLQSCSLVSRAWWPRCRYHLRSTVLLSDTSTQDKLALYQDPTISSLATKLAVTAGSKQSWRGWLEKMGGTIKLMNHVTRLHIRFPTWNYLQDGCFPAQRYTVTYITLDGVMFTSFITFLRFVCDFPKLESLSLLHVIWPVTPGSSHYEGRDMEISSVLKCCALNLKVLRLAWLSYPCLLNINEWTSLQPPPIESFSLLSITNTPSIYEDLLVQLSPSLRKVEIYEYSQSISDRRLIFYDAMLAQSHFAALKTIVIVILDASALQITNDADYRVDVQDNVPQLARRGLVTMRFENGTRPTWS